MLCPFPLLTGSCRRRLPSGQAYVALSRATHLAGIQVLNFHPRLVMHGCHCTTKLSADSNDRCCLSNLFSKVMVDERVSIREHDAALRRQGGS